MRSKKTLIHSLAGITLGLALALVSAVSVHAQTTTTGTSVATTTNNTNVGLPNTGAGGMSGENITALALSIAAVAFGLTYALRQRRIQS